MCSCKAMVHWLCIQDARKSDNLNPFSYICDIPKSSHSFPSFNFGGIASDHH